MALIESPGKLANLHTHSIFSDGLYEPKQIVEAALEAGLQYIAITDHFQTEKVRSVHVLEIPYYLQLIRELDHKYHDRITVLAGLEIDANPARTALDTLPYELLNALDFVLFEYIADVGSGGIGFDEFLKLLPRFAIPVGLAHTDLKVCFSTSQLEELQVIMIEHKLPPFIELSGSIHYRRHDKPYYEYAEDFFAGLKGTKGTVSTGGDLHGNLSKLVNVLEPAMFLERIGLADAQITARYWPRAA